MFEQFEKDTFEVIAKAGATTSRSAKPKMLRRSVVKAMMLQLSDNLKKTPVGKVNDAIDHTEKSVDHILDAIEALSPK